MKAVIPVAKKKESMFPFSDSRPTGLMPVMGKPLAKHLVKELRDAGVEDIYMVTNYMQESFEQEFGEYTNVNLVQQDSLEGTAAAVSCCDFIEDDFLVVNGDVMVTSRDIEALVEKHRAAKAEVAILATDANRPEKFGVLSIEDDRIRSIEEKPEKADNPLVNTGIYAFTPAIFDVIEDTGEADLTDAVGSLIDREEAVFEFVEDYWLDIGSPRKLLEADRIKRSHEIGSREVHDDADVSELAEVNDARIGPGAEIRAGAVVEDRSFVGENAVVGPGSVVRNSSVSRDSMVEASSLDSSVVFEETVLDRSTVIENSLLGEDVDVKPGTVIRESFIGPRSFLEINNSVYGVKFVPDARTDIAEISK